MDADTVLMEVTGRSKWGLDERLLIWDKIKNEKENCKVVLLVDENSEQELADEVRRSKRKDVSINSSMDLFPQHIYPLLSMRCSF